MSQLKYVVKGG